MRRTVPRVLVDISPEVFAEAVGRALVASGFTVQVGPIEAAEGPFDAVIEGPGGADVDAPIRLVVGHGTRVLVHHGSETGMVSAEGPGDLARVVRTLFADQIDRMPSDQVWINSRN